MTLRVFSSGSLYVQQFDVGGEDGLRHNGDDDAYVLVEEEDDDDGVER